MSRRFSTPPPAAAARAGGGGVQACDRPNLFAPRSLGHSFSLVTGECRSCSCSSGTEETINVEHRTPNAISLVGLPIYKLHLFINRSLVFTRCCRQVCYRRSLNESRAVLCFHMLSYTLDGSVGFPELALWKTLLERVEELYQVERARFDTYTPLELRAFIVETCPNLGARSNISMQYNDMICLEANVASGCS